MLRSCFGLFSSRDSQSGFTITYAVARDQHEIAAVARLAHEETYPDPYDPRKRDVLYKEFKDKNCIFLVTKSEGEIIGYAKMLIKHSDDGSTSAFLDKLYILKAHHQRGHGTLLLTRCFEEAVKHQASTMNLLAWDQNENAIRFYEKFHFEKMPKVPFQNLDGKQVECVYSIPMHCKDIALNLQSKTTLHA